MRDCLYYLSGLECGFCPSVDIFQYIMYAESYAKDQDRGNF
jgi:hypothetical protein